MRSCSQVFVADGARSFAPDEACVFVSQEGTAEATITGTKTGGTLPIACCELDWDKMVFTFPLLFPLAPFSFVLCVFRPTSLLCRWLMPHFATQRPIQILDAAVSSRTPTLTLWFVDGTSIALTFATPVC